MTVLAGRYRLDARLGRGGMGTVYRATDLASPDGAQVAVKRMTLDATEKSPARAALRFRRELHTLASLRHPRIVRAHDYGEDGGPFYVMDLLEGRDLRDELFARSALSPRDACILLRDVASALAVLHARGLVHRDLSPRNVRVIDGRATLFDFGVLANAGVAGDVAGTPAFVAPEMLRGEPVDGRADLYSLGVLAYVILTGQAPYPARELSDLFELWREPPPSPSSFAELPPALEELVLDLLCLEPLGRPPSAAAVVDRLTRVGELDADPELAVPELSLLPSTALVGRDRELRELGAALDEAKAGGSARVFVEAELGAGKSRLLDELALRAKLDGLLVLAVSGDEHEGAPYAALGALVDAAFRDARELAKEAAAPGASILGRVFSAARVADVPLAEESGEPAEDRLRVQRAAIDFVRELAARRRLLIVADDAHRIDEASAAALAGLAHARIEGCLLVVARRLGEEARAPAPLASLAGAERRIALGGLDEEGVLALLRSLFGDVPGLLRLAKALAPVSGGNPLLCTELARHLVVDGVLRHDAGTWVVPEDVKVGELPASLTSVFAERVARLRPRTRELAEGLAVHGGDVDLALVPALVEGGEAEALAALAELVGEGMALEHGDVVRLRHQACREALLAALDAEAEARWHRRVGEARWALPQERSLADEVAIGWHLRRGGELARGAALLERAGRRLYEAQALADCIAPLEAALEELEARRAPIARRAELHFFLLSAGWVSDRATGARHARPCLELHRELSGMALAERRARSIGFFLAFFVGLFVAWIRWLFRFGEARGPSPMLALNRFAVGLAYACALAYSANLKDELSGLIELARPFEAFRGQTPYAALRTVEAMRDVVDGNLARATDRLGEALALVRRRFLNPLSAGERRLAEAGVRAIRALVDVNQLDPRLFEDVDRLERSGLEYYALAAETARIVHHRYRGEEQKAQALERAAEARSLALGSWSTDLQRLLFAHPAYAFQHDVEGLKRSLAALERHRDAGMAFHDRVGITRGELLRERLEHERADAVLHATLGGLRDDDLLMRQYCLSALARNALEAYRWEDAARHARAVIEEGEDPRRRIVMPWLRCQRVLALADHALGRSDAAIARLHASIAEAERLDAPLFAGELHEARARVALDLGERLDYEVHLARAEDHLRPTACPGLVAIVERLAELGREDLRGPVDAKRRRPGGRATTSSMDESSSTVTSSRPVDAPTVASAPAALRSTDVPTTASAPSAKSGRSAASVSSSDGEAPREATVSERE